MSKATQLDEALVVVSKYAHDHAQHQHKQGLISGEEFARTMDCIHVVNLFLELIEGDYEI